MIGALESAQEYAKAEGCSKIHRICLEIGRLSGIVPEALQFAFEAMKDDTMASGAELEIKEVKAVCHCRSCDHEFTPEDVFFRCTQCGSDHIKIISGREMKITQLEIS